jgi:hypothetical protein
MNKRLLLLIAAVVGLSLAAFPASEALAHRPYFEEEDIGAVEPWFVDDPTISTAIYATLDGAGDVDYFAFDGKQGEVILLAMTIPQIEGQESFAPTMALLGPGLERIDLPGEIAVPEDAGVMLLEPPPDPAPTFFEPFSRTSYWERQERRVPLPETGRFLVAVWHPEQEVGRYTFVIGEKERLGGDLAFPFKMRSYWTPVEPVDAVATPAGKPDRSSCSGW